MTGKNPRGSIWGSTFIIKTIVFLVLLVAIPAVTVLAQTYPSAMDYSSMLNVCS